MAEWDADLYRQFEEERTRPAQELLQRVALDAPRTVADLGCGPGNSTELLVQRFPASKVIGLDTSDDMLAKARARLPHVSFEKADIGSWRPAVAPDLIYANASLQWVPDHGALLPRLMDLLAPGGVLAFQMPDNREEPTHRLMRETAQEAPWMTTIGEPAAVRVKIESAAVYYDRLAPMAADLDVWRTIYHHPMPSAAAIVDWLRATGLRPFLDPLPDNQRAAFLALYERKIAAAYPPRSDGKLLLVFPRLFVVTRRKG
jgi:trans-aconitate 2-methyltransferase